MRIVEILHHKGRRVHKIRTTDGVAQAVRALHEHDIGALLVTDRRGRHAGIFGERDLIHGIDRFGEAAPGMPVGELMTPDIVTCHPEDLVHKAISLMTVHRIRHLPVEEGGEIVGIVSIGDLVQAMLDEKALEIGVLSDMARAR